MVVIFPRGHRVRLHSTNNRGGGVTLLGNDSSRRVFHCRKGRRRSDSDTVHIFTHEILNRNQFGRGRGHFQTDLKGRETTNEEDVEKMNIQMSEKIKTEFIKLRTWNKLPFCWSIGLLLALVVVKVTQVRQMVVKLDPFVHRQWVLYDRHDSKMLTWTSNALAVVAMTRHFCRCGTRLTFCYVVPRSTPNHWTPRRLRISIVFRFLNIKRNNKKSTFGKLKIGLHFSCTAHEKVTWSTVN